MRKVKQDSTLSRRREIRLRPELDDDLKAIAERRGCDVSDVIREAALEHVRLFSRDGQTDEATEKQYKAGAA